MAFSIKNQEADLLARELAKVTGESLTDAVTTALRDRLARLRARKGPRRLSAELMEIGHRCARLPLLDGRSPDEILGYDDAGVPR
ncbi:MAG: type II toxin-antitoxin system VapB family antitoxin [Candidatus Riflebacteria bacterium]|nr:type II toxin-antitoxin system VapB family antitoxin [Candidatus Riflebacteria bacterium]